jgi:hypothetical protein
MSLFDSASLVVTPNGVKEGKLYSIKPSDGSGDLSVTRATTATRVNSAGLVEVVPKNLATYSNTFSNSAWQKQNVTITENYGISPDGTQNASLIQDSVGTSTQYRISQSIASNNNIFAISLYVKRLAGTKNAYIDLGPYTAYFNFTTETIYSATGNVSFTKLNDGWYRISLSSPTSYNISAIYLGFALNANETYTSTGGNQMLFYASQLEQKSTATDYYQTTTRLNIPRLDYTNGSCPSILVEPQRTNIYPYSNQLSQWSKSGTITITENNAISPDGTNNANRVQFTANSNLLFLSGTGLSGSNTLTVYAKAKNGVSAKFRFFANGATLFSSDQTATGEWQRFTFTYTYSALTAGLAGPTTGADDVLFYGFQHEIGSYATSYIPTTSASVTRNTDIIYKTGISSLIGQTEGVVFIDFIWNQLTGVGSYPRIIELWKDSSNYIQLFNVSGTQTVYWEIYSGGSVQFSGNTTMNLGRNKLAIGYKNNDCVFYKNGTLIASDSSATIPTTNDLGICNVYNGGAGATLSASVNSAMLWKTRLDNATLATLTTI